MNINFDSEEFKEFMEEYNSFVLQRKNEICCELEKNHKEYKEKLEEYSTLYDIMVRKYPMHEIEELEGICMESYEIENLYLYVQGFLDGIMLKNKFKKKDN